MAVKLVEPIKDRQGNFDFYEGQLTEGIKSWTGSGKEVYRVREIFPESEKAKKLLPLLRRKPCSLFLSIGDKLNYFLLNSGRGENVEKDLYIMTDFSDPRPLRGLCILEGDREIKKEKLFYIAFNTDWEQIDNGSFEEIFAHEYSHLWLYILGFEPNKMRSNVFHCVTSMTDPFTAFMEGLGNSLEIVSYQNGLEKIAQEKFDRLWDCALDITAFLSYRETQLRYWIVPNNRLVYDRLVPEIEKYDDYVKLHLDYISSSAFLPERVRSGNQILASEGFISTLFYYLYREETFKNSFSDREFYKQFDTSPAEISPLENLYLKILYAIAHIDFVNTEQPATEFIKKYVVFFPKEKDELYRLFLELTHYTTVSSQAQGLFSNFYLTGRRAEIEDFKARYKEIKEFKEETTKKVLAGELDLDAALYPPIWVENKSCQIPPCPWMPEQKENFIMDLNSASLLDLMSLTHKKEAEKIIKKRAEQNGFASLKQFQELYPHLGPKVIPINK